MGTYTISERYAKALMQLAVEKESFDKVSEDIDTVYNTLDKSKELRAVLTSPIIEEKKKIEVLDAIFSSHVGGEVQGFLKFVVEKNREDILFNIVKRYRELRDTKLGVINISITGVADFTDNQKEELKKHLEQYTGKKVKAEYKTNEKMIGGFIVKAGDKVIDASVQHQLERLRKQMLKENLVA